MKILKNLIRVLVSLGPMVMMTSACGDLNPIAKQSEPSVTAKLEKMGRLKNPSTSMQVPPCGGLTCT